jgi:hypothetical protein
METLRLRRVKILEAGYTVGDQLLWGFSELILA